MSESTTNPTVKVGDKLAFRIGSGKLADIMRGMSASPEVKPCS